MSSGFGNGENDQNNQTYETGKIAKSSSHLPSPKNKQPHGPNGMCKFPKQGPKVPMASGDGINSPEMFGFIGIIALIALISWS